MFGAELLFRNKDGETAMEVGESTATSEVLVNHCSSITDEIEHLRRPAFINVSADFFLSDAFLPVDPSKVVIELVERITVTDEFVEAVKNWKKLGFRFALDDFEFSIEWAPLLEIADVVKIDVLGQSPDKIYRRKAALQQYSCLWLAERVETQEEFDTYKQQGFDLFQGYFLSRPKIITGKKIRPEQASAAEVLRVLNSESEIDTIAKTVERDPCLSLQVLRMINSSMYTLPRPIDSVKEAVVLLGLGHLRKWAMVLSLLGNSDSEIESHRVVLIRAKFCENYAQQSCPEEADRAFMVGLLSGIDILFGIEVEVFLKLIHVSDDVALAVTQYEGRLGKMLTLALNIEKALGLKPSSLKKSSQSILDSYHQAFHWAEEVLSEAQAPGA